MPAARTGVDRNRSQAHGARLHGRRAGSVGVAAAFSFSAGKNLGALGDGGAVVTGDTTLADRIRMRANHGRAAVNRHRHDQRGCNSRPRHLREAAVLHPETRPEGWRSRSRTPAGHGALSSPTSVLVPAADTPNSRSSAHRLAVVWTPDRDAVIEKLDGAGIGWGVHYPIPCHVQPAYRDFTEFLQRIQNCSETHFVPADVPDDHQTHRSGVCDVLCELAS